MKEELTIKVVINDFNEVKGHNGNARMIAFDGTVDCENFKGVIMPGGVDTQRDYTEGQSTLSARYILDGVDREGKRCKVFIENNGVFTPEGMKTIPTILTDSEALSYLETIKLKGTIDSWEKGVIIHIFSE